MGKRDRVNKQQRLARRRRREKDPEGYKKKRGRQREERLARNPTEYAEKKERRLLRDPLVSKKAYQRRKAKDPNYLRRLNLKAKYGITLEEFDEMVALQKGKCLICGKKRRLVVDHCHKTGRVRGLLCHKCNHGIGAMEDDVRIVRRAYLYLKYR